MKEQVASLLTQAITALIEQGFLPAEVSDLRPALERPRDESHGDFACNIAMMMAKAARRKPRDIAEAIVGALPANELIEQVEIAGPGFINFRLRSELAASVVQQILELGDAFGRNTDGNGRKVQVEFVSANPTGPLHIGHGRGAAYGAVVANLLEATGWNVSREYYVNDAGRQMDILAFSVWLRYQNLCGASYNIPQAAYKGAYVIDIATALQARDGEAYVSDAAVCDPVVAKLNSAGKEEADKAIDEAVVWLRADLGEDKFATVHAFATESVLDGIRADLESFRVTYDNWFSEASLVAEDAVSSTVEQLEAAGQVFEEDGARWFRSSAYGDEKDRVLVRDNGQSTYFAGDCAYHANKIERGFDHLINIWGADHHGYVPRVKAALQALGHDPQMLEVRLVQFANLYRGTERMQMSTRSGEFVTLAELVEEVGVDATRFFYVMRKSEQHLDFDLELAKSRSNDNPVYYVQYAHARICSVFRELTERGFSFAQDEGLSALNKLDTPQETTLISALTRYPEVISAAAKMREPHQLAYYLRELANEFHTNYNANKVLIDDSAMRNARLVLMSATRQILANGLSLLGVSAPESM